MNRTLKIVRRAERKGKPQGADGGKMSVSEMLQMLDEIWRIEHAEDIARLKAKEKKVKELREAIASLDN
jgi:hypothetical protein